MDSHNCTEAVGTTIFMLCCMGVIIICGFTTAGDDDGGGGGNWTSKTCANHLYLTMLPSVLWSGDRKGMWPVKSWVLICW